MLAEFSRQRKPSPRATTAHLNCRKDRQARGVSQRRQCEAMRVATLPRFIELPPADSPHLAPNARRGHVAEMSLWKLPPLDHTWSELRASTCTQAWYRWMAFKGTDQTFLLTEAVLGDAPRGQPHLGVRFQGDAPVSASGLGRVCSLSGHLHPEVAPVDLAGGRGLARRRWGDRKGPAFPGPRRLSGMC